MIVIASKGFVKQLRAVPDDIQKRANDVYKKLHDCKKLSDVPSLEKLAGHKNYYRIRIGNYRLGFELIEDRIELLAIMHRKEVYRFFP
jgi:mRNA interferase RelE/StbE